MKLTVKHKETIIIYDETGNEKGGQDRMTSIRWEDQSKTVFELIKNISKEVQNLNQ